MSDDQFDKLFKYIEDFRGEVNQRFDEQDAKIDNIYRILDNHLKRIEDIMQENSVRDMQFERMERWIHQLADKANITLKFD